MYYWNTTFDLDSTKRDFIDRHGIGRIYLRMFDVVPGKNGEVVPNATVALGDSAVDCPVKVVPTIFILNECFRTPNDALAQKLLQRVLQMCTTHHIDIDGELQIDCDWTVSTRDNLYSFLEQLRTLAHEKGLKLSSTIRLHQLSQPVPPVDNGVLMVYNTGDMTRIDVKKPILDPKDVQPYLKYLGGYKLPLAAAYPVFRWELLFRGGKFVDVIHSRDELPILPGDSIVERRVEFADILAVKKAIEKQRDDCQSGIILYDLSNYNIKRYSSEEFEALFN